MRSRLMLKQISWVLIFTSFVFHAKADSCTRIAASTCQGFPLKITKDPTGSYNGATVNDLKIIYRDNRSLFLQAAENIAYRLFGAKLSIQQRENIETELVLDLFDGAVERTINLPNEERRAITAASAYIEARRELYREISKGLIPYEEASSLERDLWPKVKSAMSRAVRKLGGSPKVQALLQTKIRTTPWGGVDCHDNENFAEILTVNAFNDATKGVVICPGWLRQNSSRFSSAMVIAHELAHSIDLCGLAADLQDEPELLASVKNTLEPVEQCLSNRKSVGAKRESDHCGQLKEAFADYLGAEVMADLIDENVFGRLSTRELEAGLANTWRNACDSRAHDHPPTSRRLERILLIQPLLRSKLECAPAKATYCGPATPMPREAPTRPHSR